MWIIKLKPHQKLFFTSDTHYNHKNICRGITNWTHADGNTRDFPTLAKMNDTIANNINDAVGQDDILIHLGDWSFGGFESISEFKNRLICQNVYLILGNHDHHIERNKDNIQSLFVDVAQYKVLRVIDENSDDLEYDFVLSHYPIQSWDGLNKGHIQLHGHCHLPTNLRFGKGKKMDVGMDGSEEFRPYNLIREIVPIMKKREVMSDMEFDHHTDELKGLVG
jgi:calcineurin-like phosphoesterase family protein